MITKRKIIAMAATLVLVATMFLLAACGSGGQMPSSGSDTGENSEQTPSASDSSISESAEQTPVATSETFTISINRDSDPLRRRDAHSGWITIDEEILAAVAKDQGFKIKTDDTFKDFDAAQQALSAGQVDGIASMSITDEQKGIFDFTQPCFDSGDSSYGIAVAKDQNAEFLQMFDAGLSNIKNNGLYQEILDKYES
jgi:ABC-type amino acid transport substrate-binding protein